MDKFLTIGELVEYTGIKESTLRKHKKEIPHTKVGRCLRFRKSEVDLWLAAKTYMPQAVKEYAAKAGTGTGTALVAV